MAVDSMDRRVGCELRIPWQANQLWILAPNLLHSNRIGDYFDSICPIHSKARVRSRLTSSTMLSTLYCCHILAMSATLPGCWSLRLLDSAGSSASTRESFEHSTRRRHYPSSFFRRQTKNSVVCCSRIFKGKQIIHLLLLR